MSEASFSVVEPVEIEEVDRNPLEQFMLKMRHDLGGFGPQVRGPNAENLIIETIKTGKFNFDFISQQVQEIEKLDPTAGMQIARKARKHLETSAESVLFVQSKVKNIASYLLEISEHVNENEMELFRETMKDVVKTSQALSNKTMLIRGELNEDEEELMNKSREQMAKKLENERLEKRCTWGKRGAAVLSAATGAASYPVAAALGSSAATISGPLGAVSASVVSVCPVTMCICVGAAVFCGIAAMACHTKAEMHGKCARAAGEMAELTEKMGQAAEQHQSLWTGVSMAAQDLSDDIAKLKDLNSGRKRQLEQTMKDVAKSLSILVEALEEYSVWLSLCKYFPANYPLRAKIGGRRFDHLRDGLTEKGKHTEVVPASVMGA